MSEITHHTDYRQALAVIKQRIQASQIRAALAVNAELLGLYWDIGRQLYAWQRERAWGSAVVEHMALDLQASYPGMKGFSRTSLFAMRQFYAFFSPQFEVVPQPVGQMPWGHVRTLLAKIKSVELVLLYAQACTQHGWSRTVLEWQIEQRFHERSGQAVGNFAQTLPVLDKYAKASQINESYQSEYDLEQEFIQDLQNHGYEYCPDLNTPAKLLANVREQLQALNTMQFLDGEWQRFVEAWLDRPSDSIVDKTRKIHDDYIHDFVFDDGRIQNIYLLHKKNIARNKLQVIKQFETTPSLRATPPREGNDKAATEKFPSCGGVPAGRGGANRYDVTILVNGLPPVQVELKKRGVAIREAFNQVHRYSKESFNSEHSLFKYLQLFVISNGTDCRYFANTTQRSKNSFDFTMNWAKADNSLIRDLKDFAATFFQKNTLLNKVDPFELASPCLFQRPKKIRPQGLNISLNSKWLTNSLMDKAALFSVLSISAKLFRKSSCPRRRASSAMVFKVTTAWCGIGLDSRLRGNDATNLKPFCLIT